MAARMCLKTRRCTASRTLDVVVLMWSDRLSADVIGALNRSIYAADARD